MRTREASARPDGCTRGSAAERQPGVSHAEIATASSTAPSAAASESTPRLELLRPSAGIRG